ncbi:hypothetical protein GW835_03790 [archaeon]|nr:hypothetical protein [archaeon]NCP79660.1 hypothetical protein [archaeon]NCP97950.1 hypothetical protein [archaeon]NCQ07426.1 hypothetical protein [archaeon]NCQ51217.1 hypothetical protein [archaeon]
MNLNVFISKILFIGITIHELAHAFACIILGVRIRKIKLFSFSDGYVVHDESRSYKNIIISIFPFFFNIAIAIIGILLLKKEMILIYKLLIIWVSISALFFSIPSRQDANNIFDSVKKSYRLKQSLFKWFYKILLLPLTILILILSWLFKVLDQSFLIRVVLILGWVYVLLVL